MAELWLLCEGRSDVPILESVLTNILPAEIIPKPVGGGSNVASAAQYVAANAKDVIVAYVIDRDYQKKTIAEEMFGNGKRGFMWRRHSIENYLLEPSVIIEAFKNIKVSVAKNPGGAPAWVSGLPEEPAILAEGLRLCARARAPQEAGRIVINRLWEDLSESAGQIQKRFPASLSKGLPTTEMCRQALRDEVVRLVTKAKETVSSIHLEEASIRQRYDIEVLRLNEADYLNGMRFLEEFHGRDLLATFFEWLQKEYNFLMRKNHLVRELENAVPLVYQGNRLLYGTDDFRDLANGVRALANLPPIP